MKTREVHETQQANPAAHNTVLDAIGEGVFTVSLDFRISSFNRAAEVMTGICREDAIGRICSSVFRSDMCEDACALRRALSTGQPVSDASASVVDARGERIPVRVSAAALRGVNGQLTGGVETFRDLRQLEELRKELLGQSLRSAEKTLIAAALRRHRGNRGRAAKELGINPSTLYRKIRQLELAVPEGDGRRKQR